MPFGKDEAQPAGQQYDCHEVDRTHPGCKMLLSGQSALSVAWLRQFPWPLRAFDRELSNKTGAAAAAKNPKLQPATPNVHPPVKEPV